MFGPILEKMILSGEAQYKTASIGFGALEALVVPKGKSYVVTDITIQPFLNIINFQGEFNFGNTDTFIRPIGQDIQNINKRTTFQLLMYNQRGINNRWSFRNAFKIDNIFAQDNEGAPVADYTCPGIFVDEKKIDTYVLIDETTWFYFFYPDYDPGNFIGIWDNYPGYFNNVNPFPNAPFGKGTENTAISINNLNTGIYGTFGTANTINPDLAQQDTWTIPWLSRNSTIIPPSTGVQEINASWFNSMPLLNISYIEINKRTTTNGIF